MERDELPDIQHRLHRHAQYWPFADVCLEAADALDRAEAELARLRREIEAACGPIPAVDEDGDPVTYYVLATKLRRILGTSTEGGNE